jgi:hypothetical protein
VPLMHTLIRVLMPRRSRQANAIMLLLSCHRPFSTPSQRCLTYRYVSRLHIILRVSHTLHQATPLASQEPLYYVSGPSGPEDERMTIPGVACCQSVSTYPDKPNTQVWQTTENRCTDVGVAFIGEIWRPQCRPFRLASLQEQR